MNTETTDNTKFYWRKRHPLPVVAFSRHVLVLTYAVRRDALEGLLPPGLSLDTFRKLGFLAAAMVQTKRLRPAGLPAAMGGDFFLSGYRVFGRFQRGRGLRILRSETDSRWRGRRGRTVIHGLLLGEYGGLGWLYPAMAVRG